MELLIEFVGYSLTQKIKKPSGNKGYWSFVVHDLITSYLRSTISEEDTRCYHKGLVNNYREQCNRDFTSVSADGYVHQQLLYHLEQAGEHETRASLLNNLCWLRACIRHCSPSVVLAWYTKECIGKVCATVCSIIMCVCMYVLCVYVYVHICVCVCVCACVYVCVHVYVCGI